MSQFKASQKLLNPNEIKPQPNEQNPIEQKPTEQKPNESLLTRTTAFFNKINIFKTKPSNIPNPTTQKEEEEDLKTAIELDDRLSAFNIVQISALILVSLFHSFGILIIAFFFSIYQLFLSIFHIIKYCWENPWHFKYGYQALKYAYEKEWWTFKVCNFFKHVLFFKISLERNLC
uniref:Uncharacterized protein n=1 Tax=Panagrolaimus davidi TaxID=227884 RepID=A0A914NXV4_9BILA